MAERYHRGVLTVGECRVCGRKFEYVKKHGAVGYCGKTCLAIAKREQAKVSRLRRLGREIPPPPRKRLIPYAGYDGGKAWR